MTAELDKKSKYLPDSIQISTSAWAGEKFSDSDALIFIGATGIAVRSIAPYVASKKSDPAVLVVDECGKFVISLLSGHLGGANKIAEILAHGLQAVPVLTTATSPAVGQARLSWTFTPGATTPFIGFQVYATTTPEKAS